MASATDFIPLKPTTLHILLALSGKEKHGYAIRKYVENETDGQVVIRIGSLYNRLHKLLESGLIEESNRQDFEDGDSRQRKYRLTRLGKEVLAAETRRLKDILLKLEPNIGGIGTAREGRNNG